MVPQIIGRIIGRANDPHIKAFQDPVRGQSIPSQLLVGLIPDRLRGLFIQRIGNPKIASQFEMGPMVEGFLRVCGTVEAQALNLSSGSASPVQ